MIESILKVMIQIEDGDAKSAKLEGVIRNLEVERGKIEVFQRELPLSVNLLSDLIELLKEELERCKKGPVFEELMPMESKFEENRGTKVQNDAKDKMNWMSSAQLWSHNNGDREHNNDNKIEKKPSQESTSGAVLQFETFSGAEMNNHNNIISYTTTNGLIVNNPNRKTRRSWSPELHRLFISSLQKLGGAQVATPKQIRELMKVDGLTNDEVKSHLQKYRLHCRKDKEHYTSSQQSTSQSGRQLDISSSSFELEGNLTHQLDISSSLFELESSKCLILMERVVRLMSQKTMGLSEREEGFCIERERGIN